MMLWPELDQRQENLIDRCSYPGWDSYCGLPIDGKLCRKNLSLLRDILASEHGIPAPALVPGPDGTVEYVWYRNRCEFELEFVEEGKKVWFLFAEYGDAGEEKRMIEEVWESNDPRLLEFFRKVSA